jgi:hypothetical protein
MFGVGAVGRERRVETELFFPQICVESSGPAEGHIKLSRVILTRMKVLGLVLAVLAAHFADTFLYGGLYSETVLTIARHIVHGVMMGVKWYA